MINFDTIKTEQREDLYLNRTHEEVAMLNSLEGEKTHNEIRRHIVRYFTLDFEIENRTQFRKPDISRADIDFTLRERYHDLKSQKRGGRHHVVVASGRSRGGPTTGRRSG